MLVKVASSTTAAPCSTPRTGRPVSVATATKVSATVGSEMSPLTTCTSAPPARSFSMASCASAPGADREFRTIRPHPAEVISPARNRPSPPRPPVTMYDPSVRKTGTSAGDSTAGTLPW